MAETQYRFIVAYLLFFYLGITLYFGLQLPRRPRRWLLIQAACFVGPLATYVCWAELISFAGLSLDQRLRLFAILPASAAILLLFWSYRTRTVHARAGADQLCNSGPYHWLRHPITSAEAVFFFALAALSSNLLICILSAIGILLGKRQVAQEERLARSQYGCSYDAYAAQTGRMFIKLGNLKLRRYSIPRRFGLSAAMALLTTFALLFGALNYAHAPPVVYLFAGFEIVAICLGQIVFGSAPRGSSAASGALILPVCVWLSTPRPVWMPLDLYLACLLFLFLFGALLGYCLGALAAGFFLVMDLIDPYLPGGAELQLDGDVPTTAGRSSSHTTSQ